MLYYIVNINNTVYTNMGEEKPDLNSMYQSVTFPPHGDSVVGGGHNADLNPL